MDKYLIINDRGFIADPNVYDTWEEAANALIYVYTLFKEKYNLVQNLKVITMKEYMIEMQGLLALADVQEIVMTKYE